jgi:hypothetical protein
MKRVPARHPLDFPGVIGSWPSVRDFSAATGTPDATARAWRTRDWIPVEHWDAIITAAHRDQVPGISIDSLMGAVRIALARRAAVEARKRAASAVPRGNRGPRHLAIAGMRNTYRTTFVHIARK